MINVLSAFDGFSGARIALDQLGIDCKYYASEVDTYAMKVALNNYPDTTQLGNVKDVEVGDLPKIDLLIGGSPCKDLSVANKGKLGLEGEKSKLFYEFVRLKKELNPKYFLLENVVPVDNWKEVMDEHMGCTGIVINSSLFVPQNRKRIYWTNIPQSIPVQQKYNFNFESADKKYIASDNILLNPDRMKFILSRKNELCGCLTEALARNGSSKEYMAWVGWVNNNIGVLRKPTPVEAERLQAIPDNYTSGVSDTQRYKMIGNGFTISVIKHLLEPIKKEFQ